MPAESKHQYVASQPHICADSSTGHGTEHANLQRYRRSQHFCLQHDSSARALTSNHVIEARCLTVLQEYQLYLPVRGRHDITVKAPDIRT